MLEDSFIHFRKSQELSLPYTKGLVVHATFFSHNSLKRHMTIFFFFPNFLAEFSTKCFFCLVVRGVYPPYTRSGPTTKKTTFLCVSSLRGSWDFHSILRLKKIKGKKEAKP